MAKKKFDFSDTSISKEEAQKRLESLGIGGPKAETHASEEKLKKSPVKKVEAARDIKPQKQSGGGGEGEEAISPPQSVSRPIKAAQGAVEEDHEGKDLAGEGRTLSKARSGSKYRGVPAGFIRFSYIVREEYHETLRSMAKEHGASIREIMDHAFEVTIGKYVGQYEPIPQKEANTPEKEEKLKKLF